MGNRLSKVITRTGDKGTTGMADGSRREKNDALVHCLGEVDELNAHIGVVLSLLQQGRAHQYHESCGVESAAVAIVNFVYSTNPVCSLHMSFPAPFMESCHCVIHLAVLSYMAE